jgi:hypothetical protein
MVVTVAATMVVTVAAKATAPNKLPIFYFYF